MGRSLRQVSGSDDKSSASVVRKCTRCGKPATRQTTKGKYAEEHGHLPQNHGYYCDACWEEGMELEREAMYG